MSANAWRIAEGRVEPVVLPEPPDYYVVPGIRAAALDSTMLVPVRVLPGAHHSEWAYALPLVEEVATRITPWATWYAAPGFFGSASWGGCAWSAEGVALVLSTADPVHAVSVALHEAWNLAEEHVARARLAALDARLSQGPDWPGEYHPRTVERRARAFAAFGSYLIEGGRMAVEGPGVPPEVTLFWAIFSGALGREVTEARISKQPCLLRRTAAWIGL